MNAEMTLDEAWAAAEAALPANRGNLTWGLSHRVGGDDYYVWADDMGEPGSGGTFALEATGPTPAAALQALTERLQELRCNLYLPADNTICDEPRGHDSGAHEPARLQEQPR